MYLQLTHNVGLCGSTGRQGAQELDVLARVRLHRPPRHAARVGVDAQVEGGGDRALAQDLDLVGP